MQRRRCEDNVRVDRDSCGKLSTRRDGSRKKYPPKKRQLNKLAAFFSYAVTTCGDMTPALAESLLDDLSTDGHKLHSAKIDEFGAKLLTLIQLHGPDIPTPAINHVNS